MRKSFALLLAAILITGCNNLIEEKLEIYDDAIDELDGIDGFTDLMYEVIATERAAAHAEGKMKEKNWNKLKEKYGTEYELMLDSIENIRDSYLKRVDLLFLGYTYNFVERRTLLYRMAADSYCTAEYMQELDAVREVIKRYSALSYVDGQRHCDPPLKIREEYEAARELAENCYNVAKARINENREPQGHTDMSAR